MPKTPNAETLLEVQDARMSYGAQGKGPLEIGRAHV